MRPCTLLLIVVTFWGGGFSSFGIANEPNVAADTSTAFLSRYCFDCHGSDVQEGGVRFDTLVDQLVHEESDARLWDQALTHVQIMEMPPRDALQPEREERIKFVSEVENLLITSGFDSELQKRRSLPQYANYVDHEALFDGSVTEAPFTPARLWRQRPVIYDEIWGNAYGRAPWFSVKIGGTGNHLIERGPHRGKLMATRYFQDQKYANPFFEFVHRASGFSDYASVIADQASLEALLVNAETMAQILTEGQKVRIVTQVKNKGSRTGNNEAMFVGGVTTTANEYRGRIPVIFREICEAEGQVDQQDFNRGLDVAFALFLRRTPTGDEYLKYWETVFQRNELLGNKMAWQAVLIYITLTPEFVYRMELGLSEAEEDGRRFLSPQELTYAIHYALNNRPAYGVSEIETVDVYTKKSETPIQKTMTTPRPAWASGNGSVANEMQAGRLETRSDVERIVREALAVNNDSWATNHNRTYLSKPNPRILQFFREFFGYHKAPEVFKDVNEFEKRDGFRQFDQGTASKLVYDTDSLILKILMDDQDVLYRLLTTNEIAAVYWNGKNDQVQMQRAGGEAKYRLSHHLQNYNLDPFEEAYDKDGSDDANVRSNGKVFAIAPEQRCGILTQPSWLVAHSGNFDNDPVRRGKWIREKLLAGTVLEVPIDVDARIPDDEHQTLRERFSVVREEACWRCHEKMNPLGMPFEAYNHVGRWREQELGKPVDTSGEISFTGDPALNGDVKDVRELMEKLGRSSLVRQSFVRHVFRYFMGRNEMLSDSRTLIEMDRRYVETGGSFNEMLVSLLTSDSFLYRK